MSTMMINKPVACSPSLYLTFIRGVYPSLYEVEEISPEGETMSHTAHALDTDTGHFNAWCFDLLQVKQAH